MSAIPIARSPDLFRLREAGFNIVVTNAGFLVVRDVPYVTSQRQIALGAVACQLDLAGDVTVQPSDHTAKFMGEYPCDKEGAPMEPLRHSSEAIALGNGLTAQHSFSRKPQRGHYLDYFEKMTTYVSLIMQPALELDPSVTAKTRQVVEPEPGESPFNYLDMASSRSEIHEINARLSGIKIAIIGLGGTGSYILDAVAKSPVDEIHLFDADVLLTHNAFRAPGAPSLDELRGQPLKVDYFQGIYSKMRKGIITHPVKVDGSNIGLLTGMTFVFLAMDGGSAKRAIIEQLEAWETPFVDVGMGLYVKRKKIGGLLRVVLSLPDAREEARARISFTEDDALNEYDRNIQIAELNGLNAFFAVIAWKKHFGYYSDMGHERFLSYSVANSLLTKDDLHGGSVED
ncbi:ThiF family adenylyltransferase [Variovorax rhizosphaerae]|uniref:ThiF family adenylyltransferase n=1 Tax=Variovorax rhizosphaerae TaxID=1836200 RepID=A0ABU8WTD2_9BURK